MPTFRIAITGDYLGEDGQLAYGDSGTSLLTAAAPAVRFHFLKEQAPRPGDPSYWKGLYSMEVTAEQIADIDGLVVLRPYIKRSTFVRGAGSLVIIGRSGAGYDKIDLAACTENDVAVFNVPNVLDHSTASTALLFMLALAKRLFAQERITRAGHWERQVSVMGSEIEGRTLGIIGLGQSGRELVRLAAPFRMRVLAYSPHANQADAAGLNVRLTTLDEVLAEADFVSLHCRLTAETRRLIGAKEIARMKRTAFLINIARGGLVDQGALTVALREGRIAGAGLDVFATEPLPAEDPLTGLDNVILTPHWSCSTRDIWDATGKATAEGMLAATRGDVPANVLNRDVLERPGFRAKLARFNENR
jgi:phosphoglycerate dehydrogenase-like enzyme